MVYLDNAATTFPKPPCVIKAVTDCLNYYCGNPGRSSHSLSVRSAEKIYECREAICQLINYPATEKVVFTYNATYALNIAIKSTVSPNTHIIVSDLEHNSVIRPLEKICKDKGVSYSIFNTDGSVDDIRRSILSTVNEKTTLIISTLASNVTGKRIPLDVLSDISREKGLRLIADASQYIGHYPIDLRKTPCDILCAPAHKSLFGIQGCGFLVMCEDSLCDTVIEGGSGSDSKSVEMPLQLPDRLEAGTPSTPAITSLIAGLSFLKKEGMDAIVNKTEKLTNMISERLLCIKGVTLYGSECGIVSFNIADIPSDIVGEELNKRGICVRSGFHCAPSAHKKLGTEKNGCIRASVSYLNSPRDPDIFYRAIKDISANYL